MKHIVGMGPAETPNTVGKEVGVHVCETVKTSPAHTEDRMCIGQYATVIMSMTRFTCTCVSMRAPQPCNTLIHDKPSTQ